MSEKNSLKIRLNEFDTRLECNEHTSLNVLTLDCTNEHTHKHTHTLSLSLSHTHKHTYTHTHTHTHKHTHTHTLSLSHTHTQTHTHESCYHPMSLPRSETVVNECQELNLISVTDVVKYFFSKKDIFKTVIVL